MWRCGASPTLAAYEEWAPYYPPRPHNALMEVEQAAMLSLLPPVYGMKALDAGCGSGRYVRVLRLRGAAQVIGVDTSPAMLARAREQSHALARANLRTLPFRSDTFDLVVCGLVVPDEPNLPAMLGELSRVLRRGGTLLYSTLHPRGANGGWKRTFSTTRGVGELPAHWHSVSEHERACAAAGLQIDSLLEPGLAPAEPVALVARARRV